MIPYSLDSGKMGTAQDHEALYEPGHFNKPFLEHLLHVAPLSSVCLSGEFYGISHAGQASMYSR